MGNSVQIRVEADLAAANAAVARMKPEFEAIAKDASAGFSAASRGVEDFAPRLDKVHQGARLLEADLGVRLPRAVTTAVSEMIPQLASLGSVFIGVFAVEAVYRFGKAGVDAIREMRGETAELKSLMDSILSDQEALLRHPKTLKAAQDDLNETNRRLGELSQKTAALEKELAGAGQVAADGIKAATAVTGELVSRSIVTITRELNALQPEYDKLMERQHAQQDEYNRLVVEGQKSVAEVLNRSMRETAEEAKRADEKRIQGIQWVRREQEKNALAQIRGMQEAGKIREQIEAQQFAATGNQNRANVVALGIYEDIFSVDKSQSQILAGALLPQWRQQIAATVHLTAAKKELLLMEQELTSVMEKEEAAIAKSTIATIVHGVAAGESFKKVAHAAIASVAEQAAIQAIWELAQGLAMEALFFFMPDPAYEASADAHFASAAVYGGIGAVAGGAAATTRSARGAGAGGGVGGYGSGRYSGDGSGRSGGSSQDQYDPDTLAPGAAGGRQLTVLVVGDNEAGQWMAGTLNRAVDNGVHLTSTVSQRGAPVGH